MFIGNFKHIISYGKIKPRKHLRHGHWFKNPTKVNEKKPENNNQESDKKNWCPGIKIGDIIMSEKNPIIYERN